jgi:hypothetical protein
MEGRDISVRKIGDGTVPGAHGYANTIIGWPLTVLPEVGLHSL